MPGLVVHVSNRLETLSERLAKIVAAPLGESLQPETIIVQSRGMQRWISMELARRNGICANTRFPFPNAFLDQIFRRLFPDLPAVSPFEPDLLSAKIMKALPQLVDLPEFEPLKRYLQDDPNQLKLFQLSQRIADTFDQYMVFRPQMIFAWEKGRERIDPEQRWQPLLWRKITRGKRRLHRSFLQKELLRRLQSQPVDVSLLPARIHMFGISYLPPFHLQAFAAMARVAAVQIFLLNPCREYWADILDTRDIQRITRQYTIAEHTEAFYHLEQGNPLLASLGTLGRDFLSLVSDTDGDIADCFSDVPCRSLLTCIQTDILDMADRGAGAAAGSGPNDEGAADIAGRQPAGTDLGQDESIRIHACHSPIREIEVLHDRLLALFEDQPDLKPRDIIVMTPDIETYAPFIHAVFGTQPDKSTAIPYSIADQSDRAASPILDAFCRLLSVKGSRFSVSQIMGILELPGVKERFGLTQPELNRITGWIDDVNIRWGRDGNSRAALGLPPLVDNTWMAGVKRLLLGLAMPADRQRLFSGILPYDHIEGQDAQILGKLLEFLQALFTLADSLQQPRLPLQWQQRLADVLEQFFLFDERTAREMQQIRRALESLGQLETVGGYDRELPVEVAGAFLDRQFRRSSHGAGFMSAGVTFCAMLPMRSIPFQIVCLIGMNSDAIPRDNPPLGFDLIHRHPRPGDRSRRSDDKYLFLEAILSARRSLIISYVGQSIEDNAPLPPSVLVSELLDYLHRGFSIDEETVVIRHPLQAFSPRYFQGDDPSLLSFSRENYDALAGRRSHQIPEAFFSEPLPELPAESRNLSVEQLCAFFQHPIRFLLQNRLSLRLEELAIPERDREPFALDPLARHLMGQTLVERGLAGVDLAGFYPVQKATGTLPQGTVGEIAYQGLQTDAADFVTRLQTEAQGRQPQQQSLQLTIAGFELSGVITGLYPHARIQGRFARTTARDLLSAWIYHLCLGLAADGQRPVRSILVTRDETLVFDRIEQPEAILEDLLKIYWQGQHAPLHFFPELSLEFYRLTAIKGKPPADAVRSLRSKWVGSDYHRGQLDDPYVRICFERTDPFDNSFQQLAERVFRPLVVCMETSS